MEKQPFDHLTNEQKESLSKAVQELLFLHLRTLKYAEIPPEERMKTLRTMCNPTLQQIQLEYGLTNDELQLAYEAAAADFQRYLEMPVPIRQAYVQIEHAVLTITSMA